jgi:Bacterial extracellular solute-binding proteins, family 5 Middle
MRARLAFPVCTAAPLLLALTGCGAGRDKPVEVIAIGDPASLFVTGPRLPQPAQLLRSATVEGLVGFDQQGRVVPALADRWIVTEGGLSYIFRLRDGTWPDGSPITADAARTALQAAMADLKGTALGLDLSGVSQVRTMAGRVVELRLSEPVPDLLQLLAQPELGLVWRGRGNGPMKLKRNGRVAGLTPIAPEDRGLPSEEDWKERARAINLRALPAPGAIERFGRGDADAVFGGRLDDLPLVDAARISRGALRVDPVTGLFGLVVVRAEGFLALPENREALAMAIDRDEIADQFALSGWVATSRVVAPGLEGDAGTIGERWIGDTITVRRSRAAARVAAWRANVRGAPLVRLALPEGPGMDVLFARLDAGFKAVGVETRRVGMLAPADLRLLDLVARYPRPDWFLNQLSCTNARGLCDSTADLLAARARASENLAERLDLQGDAEAKLTKTNSYIPIGAPVRWSLASGILTGFAPNRWNVHPLLALAMRPR